MIASCSCNILSDQKYQLKFTGKNENQSKIEFFL